MSDIPQAGPQGSSHRVLKAVVIGLGVLIVIAFVILVIGVVIKFKGHATPTGAQAGYVLPAGAKIVDIQTQPGRLILRARTATGEEVDIIDTQDGHLISQVKAGR